MTKMDGEKTKINNPRGSFCPPFFSGPRAILFSGPCAIFLGALAPPFFLVAPVPFFLGAPAPFFVWFRISIFCNLVYI